MTIPSHPPTRALAAALFAGLLTVGVGFAQPRDGEGPHPGTRQGPPEDRPRTLLVAPPMERWDDWSDFYLSSPVDPVRDPMSWFSYQYLRGSVLQRRAQLLEQVRTHVLGSEELADCAAPKRERVERILDLRQELILLDQEHFVELFREEAQQVAEGFAAWEERAGEDSPRRRVAAASRQRIEELLEDGESFEALVGGMEELSRERWRIGRRHSDREDRLRREIELLEARLKNLRQEVERLDWENRMGPDSADRPDARPRGEERDPARAVPPEERSLMPGLGEEGRNPATRNPAGEEPPRRGRGQPER